MGTGVTEGWGFYLEGLGNAFTELKINPNDFVGIESYKRNTPLYASPNQVCITFIFKLPFFLNISSANHRYVLQLFNAFDIKTGSVVTSASTFITGLDANVI